MFIFSILRLYKNITRYFQTNSRFILGYWLFHCHFLFHIVIGMNLVLHVGAQADLPPVPDNFPTCGDFLPPISLH